MSEDALVQARAMLDELTEAARKGAIIPFRLTGQLEAIAEMLAKAQEEQAKAAPAAAPDMVEQANFMSHAIHDLRLPLTSIRGYSDMLASPSMGELTPMQMQFLGTVRTNARRLESLLTDVSDASKIRGKTLKMNPKLDMFKNIAMMVEKNMKQTAQDLNRTLTFDIPSGLPLLNVDGELLAKALGKLVENALRYIEVENGEVKVIASADGSTLKITIEDNGIGITPEEMAHLGTVYFRGDNETVQKHKGSGLGIPIAYGLIEMLGGSVSVTSEEGKGSTFVVMLTGMS
jgi:signal transduction histidine kinase